MFGCAVSLLLGGLFPALQCWGCSLAAVPGLPIEVASVVAEHGVQAP